MEKRFEPKEVWKHFDEICENPCYEVSERVDVFLVKNKDFGKRVIIVLTSQNKPILIKNTKDLINKLRQCKGVPRDDIKKTLTFVNKRLRDLNSEEISLGVKAAGLIGAEVRKKQRVKKASQQQ